MGIIWNHDQAGYRGTAYVYTSDNYFKTNFGLLSANTWYHLAATYDGSVLSAYKNGVLTSTVAVTGTLAAATGSLIIGKHPSVAHYWEGSIDEARVWNVARTCSEINQAMNTNIPGNTPGLKAYYKFDEGVAVSTNTSITTVIDATPNANNAIASNFAMTGKSSNYVSAAPLNNPINSSCLATGLNSLSTSKSDYIIYPNPTNSILNIECENSATILIVNLLGEVVKTEIVNEISKIDVSLLKPGVYFIQDSKSGKAIKFIKE
jgi:hypothetical protein